MRNILRSLFGIIVSVFFIWLALRGIDFRLVLSYLQRLSPEPIALCLAAQFCYQILHWSRWGLVIRQLGRVSWMHIFIIGAIGNAALYTIPARAGEIVRPTLAARENEINFGQATATSVIERIVDGLLVSAILFGSLASLKEEATLDSIYTSGVVFSAIFFSGILILFIGSKYQKTISRFLQRITNRISFQGAARLSDLFESFIQGIRLTSTGNVLLPYLVMSVAVWGIDILSLYWLFGILNLNLPFAAAPVVIAILALGSLIPSGPAQLGVFEFAITFALSLFLVEPEEAILFATLFHILMVSAALIPASIGLVLGYGRIDLRTTSYE